ncbi:membrane protein [Humibacter soli]
MSDNTETGWVGWGWFAGVVIIVAGVFDAIYGLIAIVGPDSAYFLKADGSLALFNISGWGWWHLIIGLFLVLVGIALLAGATWARVIAIILVILNAIGQLFLLPVQPWWSLIILALDIVVIYALTVHGRELRRV